MTETKKAYQSITDDFVQGLTSGQSWLLKDGINNPAPVNGNNGKQFSALNWLNLTSGADDPRWFSKTGADRAGLQLKEGAKGKTVSFWQFTDKKPLLDDQGQKVLAEDGTYEMETVELDKPILRLYTVFNGQDFEGLAPLSDVVSPSVDMASITEIMRNSGVKVEHDQQVQSFYRGKDDSIHLMRPEAYPNEQTYAFEALKAVVRASRDKSRLNRPIGPYGSDLYAKEELKVVLATAMLAQKLGIPFNGSGNDAYVKSWTEILAKDSYELARATKDAEKIKEYVMGLSQNKTLYYAADLNAEQATLPEVLNGLWQAVEARDLFQLSQICESLEDSPFLEDRYFNAVIHDIREIEIGIRDEMDNQTLAAAGKIEPLTYEYDFERRWASIGKMINDYECDLTKNSQQNYEVVGFRRVSSKEPDPGTPWLRLDESSTEQANFYALVKNGEILQTFTSRVEAEQEQKLNVLLDKHEGLAMKIRPISNTSREKVFLDVPFMEKGLAKALGASWDNGKQSWCARPGTDLHRVQKWVPESETPKMAYKVELFKGSNSEPYAARGAIDRLATLGDVNSLEECMALADFAVDNMLALRDAPGIQKTNHFIKAAGEAVAARAAYNSVESDLRSEQVYLHTLSSIVSTYAADLSADLQQPDKAPNEMTTVSDKFEPELATEKTFLSVPFSQKEVARNLGAKWDGEVKLWFAPEGSDLAKLAQWIPDKAPEPLKNLSPEAEFLQALEKAGLKVSGPLMMNGKIHRCAVDGGKQGALDGAYSGHLDGRPNGWIQNHKTGEKTKWVATGQALSEEQKTAMKIEAAEKLARRAEERAEAQAVAIEKASKIFSQGHDNLNALPDNYLEKKGVFNHPKRDRLGSRLLSNIRCDFYEDDKVMRGKLPEDSFNAAWYKEQEMAANILIPAYDKEGNLQTVQTIGLDGQKSFAKGCPKAGAMHLIAPKVKSDEIEMRNKDTDQNELATVSTVEHPKSLRELNKPPTIYISEGYATGASVYLATQNPVVVAFDANNLKAVAMAVREIHPEANIILCADNDHKNEKNTGLERAQEAANEVGGQVIAPQFTKDEKEKGLSDFNDLHQARGLGAVRNCLLERKSLGKVLNTVKDKIKSAVPTKGAKPNKGAGLGL